MMIWLKQYAHCVHCTVLRAFVMGTTAWAGSGSGKTLVEIQKQGEVQGKKTEEEETPRETVESSVQWTRDGFLRDQKAENWSLWNQEIISEESSIKNLRHMWRHSFTIWETVQCYRKRKKSRRALWRGQSCLAAGNRLEWHRPAGSVAAALPRMGGGREREPPLVSALLSTTTSLLQGTTSRSSSTPIVFFEGGVKWDFLKQGVAWGALGGGEGFLGELRKMVVLACSGPATRAAMVAMVLLASHWGWWRGG